MEITIAPHRPAPTPWVRLLALVVVVAPVSMLALLPIGLGLERYVMTGDTMNAGPDGIPPGAVVFERKVPLSDLRVGDVITFRPPPHAADGMVTHRIVEIDTRGIRTRGDAESATDPWVLEPSAPTVPRVQYALPWVGYLYLAVVHPGTWLALGAAMLLVALLGLRAAARTAGVPQ
jgi:signal peptidase